MDAAGSSLISSTQSLAADASSLNRLKYQANNATPATIKETARQFESLFMRELLKSMRSATMKSGLFDSPQGDLGTDLLDQQFAVQMTGIPGGLSSLIERQLMRQMQAQANAPAASGQVSAAGSDGAVADSAAIADDDDLSPATAGIRRFVHQHGAAARAAQASTGVPASYMLGQAGHESGWGQHEITMPDGTSAHNLFGIKAGADWKGKVAEVATTEYVGGRAVHTVARFRAYDSYAEGFRDYAGLVSTSPRYAQARQQQGSVQGWAQGLQSGGYATDPDYAAKLSRAINTALRVQRAQG